MAGDEAISELLRVQPGELRFMFRLNKQLSSILRLINTTKSNVAFKAQHDMPSDPQQCKDKFLVQSVVAPDGFTSGDINQEMFLKDSGNQVHDLKLKVALIMSEEDDAAGGNDYHDDGNELGSLKAKIQEVNAALTTVSEERTAAIALSQRLQQEMSILTANRRTEARHTGFSFFVVFLIGILGILVGLLISS